jgi:hypothetical protein
MALPRQAEVLTGEPKGACHEQASREGQELRPHSFPGCLQVRCTLRGWDVAHIVRGEQVGDRPEECPDQKDGCKSADNEHRTSVAAPSSGKSRDHGIEGTGYRRSLVLASVTLPAERPPGW